MNKPKFHVKKGDLVKVISGAFKGVEGTILAVQTKKQRVHVEGVPKQKKTIRPSQEKPEGGFTEIERPVHISNVKKVEVTAAKPAAKKAARKKAVEKKKQ